MPVVIEAVCCCSTKDYYFTDIYTQWRLWCHAIAISYDPRMWKNMDTVFEISAVGLGTLSSLWAHHPLTSVTLKSLVPMFYCFTVFVKGRKVGYA